MSADKELWKKSEDLCRVFAVIEGMGLKDYVEFDPEVIRGLDAAIGKLCELAHHRGGHVVGLRHAQRTAGLCPHTPAVLPGAGLPGGYSSHGGDRADIELTLYANIE